jgi:hypothetical protein
MYNNLDKASSLSIESLVALVPSFTPHGALLLLTLLLLALLLAVCFVAGHLPADHV